MTRINELIVRGMSTADFPFEVYVTKNAGFNYAKQKNQLTESAYGTGAIVNEIKAFPPIQKSYTIYCPNATLKDMRQITGWLSYNGAVSLIASDEPDVFYEILDVDVTDATLHEVKGYQVDIIFTTMPFGYEHNTTIQRYVGSGTLLNHTNAPMYPVVDVYGTSASEQSVRIGDQVVKLKYLNGLITIDSKPLLQTVFDKNMRELNSVMSGDFFEIREGSTNQVSMSSGVDYVEIRTRWAWL